MLTTLIAPTSGTAEVAGYDVVREQRAVRRSIGYVGQGNAAGHQQRGRDEVVSQARSHGLSRAAANARADELLAAFDLAEHAGRPVSTLSGGQRRRLDVAIGLVHRPRLMFLDEPSTGLDPQNRVNLQEQVQRLNRELGTTIVLTTHYLEEADAIADRVIVIDQGVVIADDSATRLKSRLGDLVSLGFGSRADAAAAAERAVRIDGANVEVSRGRRRRPRRPRPRPGGLAGHRPGGGRDAREPDRGRQRHPRRRLPAPDRTQPAREQRDPDRDERRSRSMTTIEISGTAVPAGATHDEPVETGFVADTWNVMTRELKPMLREPASVLFAMVQPLVFLALFAPLLPDVGDGSALQWFVPGIIAMTALMGASMTGSNLTMEINTGSHERLLVSPLRRSSLLVGRALKEVVPMLAQGVLIVVVVTPFSFDLHLGGVLLGLAILALFSVGVGSLSFALAIVSEGQDWLFWTVQQTLIFPVLLLAGVLLPRRRDRPRLAAVPGRPEPARLHHRGRARPVRRLLPGRHRRLRVRGRRRGRLPRPRGRPADDAPLQLTHLHADPPLIRDGSA